MKQVPSENDFVIRLSSDKQEEARQGLASLGELEPLNAKDLFLLRVNQTTDAPEVTWRKVTERVKSADLVQPVLIDERDYPHYPTGEISVRFKDALSDAQLAEFAAAHKLRVRKRNEFVAEQAVFSPLAANEVYLPEAVKRLATDDRVSEAWANTLSQYERVPSKR
jgi:hypothetical protein